MKKKKEKSPEQIAAHEAAKKYKRDHKSLSTKIKNRIRTHTLRQVELELEHLELRPNQPLEKDLPHSVYVEIFKTAIAEYKTGL